MLRDPIPTEARVSTIPAILSESLGHADPGFTLRTYTHLMPSSAERTRRAVDAVLTPTHDEGPAAPSADGKTGPLSSDGLLTA